MKELLTLNNISLFLILLIIILLLHTRYKKRNHLHYQNNKFKENFESSVFDTINNKIIEEKTLTDTIQGQIINLKTNKENNKDLVELSKYNGDITNKLNNINNYNNIINKLHNKRISNIHKKVTELNPTNTMNSNKLNNNDINYIKNPIHNMSLEVNSNNSDTYKIKVNDDNCIYYNINDDKYNISECNDLTNQYFNLNKVAKKDSCYKYPLTDPPELNDDIPLEECEGVNLIQKQNKEQYIKDYNENIPEFFHIDDYSYELSPQEFYYITPNIDANTDTDTDNIKQCLTVDKNENNTPTFSFKTCKNLPNQRWNGIKNTNIDNSC